MHEIIYTVYVKEMVSETIFFSDQFKTDRNKYKIPTLQGAVSFYGGMKRLLDAVDFAVWFGKSTYECRLVLLVTEFDPDSPTSITLAEQVWQSSGASED